MEPKPLSNLVSLTSLSPGDPKVVDVPPAEIANFVAIGVLYMDPEVRGTRQGKWCCRLEGMKCSA